jgi:hypothetical protein
MSWTRTLLAALAVCTGPGNFTGIRVGVAAARGLALGLGVPAVGVTAFEAQSLAAPQRQTFAIKAQGRWYLQTAEAGAGRGAPRGGGARGRRLDILLWADGFWARPGPVVPHPDMRRRRFVLDPLDEIVPCWRDPLTGATVRQLRHRLRAPRPVDRRAGRS